LKSDGQLNGKYPGGIPGLEKRLLSEGHKVARRGKNFFARDFQHTLFVPRS
jgi:hypothetical protein